MDTTLYTPETLAIIGGVVAVVVQIVKGGGFPRNHALWATGIASFLAVLIFTWSKGTFSRAGVWDMLVAIGLVYTTAVAAYETIKTTAVGVQRLGGPDINNTRSILILIAAGSTLTLSACGGNRYKAGTTITQAMAYELDAGLKPLVETQGKVIAAVDAACLPASPTANQAQCAQLKPVADKFLKPVDQFLALVEKDVSPRLKQLDAAIAAVDAAKQGTLRAELIPLFVKLNDLAREAFGTALPDSLVSKATTLAGKAVTTFVQLRDAVMDLVNKIRADATGTITPAPPEPAPAV